MAKLKLGPIPSDKPVKVALSLPGALHRDLLAYADILARETGQPISDPVKLIVPMLERFIATDREFAKARREAESALPTASRPSPSSPGPSSAPG
ncbi:DUF2274 domain-containing protein [Ancylobacter sp. TS-1]|uniref:DUF2274 domain-containing protein n=1 Tax=Ancylobacter sp. TS-1 TaxID=1850374 RepID=UPI001265D277|nr:DUF2274 domain-containing protein [Ancylobacter sp. TS-1]QFR34617.1 DUF2274 domain-containing protein [Ancylobacter sp. TS-1]